MWNKNKLNIGLLILSNSWGGAEQSVYNLAKRIDKKSINLYLLTNVFLYSRYKDLGKVKLINLGEYDSFHKFRKIYSLYKIKNRVYRIINKYKLDVLHINLENSILLFATSINLPEIPIVLTLRGDEARFYQTPKKLEHTLIKLTINRILNKKGNKVISVSNWLIKDFPKHIKNKISVIHNGLDTNYFKPLMLKRVKNTVLYFGRIVPGKGIEELVEVAKRLKNYKFLFAGKGDLTKLLTLTNTKYLGFKLYDEIIKLCSSVSVCAFPSHAEGMPMAGLEAMSCKVPIVASFVGYSEYIKNNVDGLLVEPGNVDQLTEAIIKVTKDEKLSLRLSENGRKKALMFDIKNTAKNYLNLYKKMAGASVFTF